jgi:hypothetical protein
VNAVITDIQHGIRTGRYANEAAVSRGIVLRILEELLGWPKYDTRIIWPEYSLEGRRVDFALCHPPEKPIAFVEVKPIGQDSEGDRQLFEYAFYRGIPMAILTNGQVWHFFLPAEQGDYGERRVYKLDLLERDPAESVERLRRYLEYRAVCSGAALDAARADYRDVAKAREVKRTLPEAWRKLVDEGDELLLELVADKVESLCGYKPEPDMVASFLLSDLQLSTSITRQVTPTAKVLPERRPAPRMPQSTSMQTPQFTGQESPQGIGFYFEGQYFPARNARDVWLKVLQRLTDRDPQFAERFSERPKRRLKERPYIARSPEALYPGSPHLAEVPDRWRELRPGSGWWVDFNISKRSMEVAIEKACKIAGLRYGTDVKVNLGQ